MNKIRIRSGFFIDRLQKIKTDKHDDFTFGKVLMVKEKIFSKKLTPYDADSGKPIIELQMFNEEDREYHTVDINSITKVKNGFGVIYK